MRFICYGISLRNKVTIMSIIRPKRKRTKNRIFIDSIFIAYFILLVVYVLNGQYWQVDMVGTIVEYTAFGLLLVIAGIIIYKIIEQVRKGRSS